MCFTRVWKNCVCSCWKIKCPQQAVSFNLFILKCRLLEIPFPLSYDITALGHSWCGRTSWGRGMLFGSLSGSVGFCKQHMALTDERHTRQQDSPRLGLLSRSQTHEHMKDRWLCVGSSETQGMFPLLSLLPQMRLKTKLILFLAFGACRLLYITGWWYWPWKERLLVLTDGCH